MIIRVLPDQVARQWNIVRLAVEAILPVGPHSLEYRVSNILTSLMNESMHCWYITQDGKVIGIILTTFTFDPTGGKSLCIYGLYGYEKIDMHIWKEITGTMIDWAKGNSCDEITVYTENPSVAKVLRRYNGIEMTYITIPIGG